MSFPFFEILHQLSLWITKRESLTRNNLHVVHDLRLTHEMYLELPTLHR
jgi:hypothetical protein